MNNTLMIINILSVTYYTFTGIVFIFILLGIIGKFGLFPLNLGIFGIVDEGIRQLPRRDRLRRVSSYGTGIKRFV